MLAKANRLRKERDIKRLWKFGASYYSPWLALRKLRNEKGTTRFGIIVSNKIVKESTRRNKIKRRLREIVRLNLTKIKPGFDCLLIARPLIVGQKYIDIKREVNILLKRANLLI